jgi:iron complex transport system substrate-binding protein
MKMVSGLCKEPPKRVVSLVPSLTESLFDLGFGYSLVGITDYCIHPPVQTNHLPKVGGTKNARLADILELRPDLVLASQEENERPLIEHLQEMGIPVWLTFPRSIQMVIDSLWELVGIYQSDQAGIRLRTLETAVEYFLLSQADRVPVRYFCPIWQEGTDPGDWWMTFNQDTYSHDLLRVLGGENVFGTRQRKYPLLADLGAGLAEPVGDRDIRYPRVTRQDILSAQPEIILLPSEPFPFSSEYRDVLMNHFMETPAGKAGRIVCLPGDLITWSGTRLGKALLELGNLFIFN